jgi:hypothetical protein
LRIVVCREKRLNLGDADAVGEMRSMSVAQNVKRLRVQIVELDRATGLGSQRMSRVPWNFGGGR